MFKTSIFKIKVYKTEYFFKIAEVTNDLPYDNTRWHEAKISENTYYSHTEEIKKVEVSMPMLKPGDKFYFEDEDILVTIGEVHRTDKNNIIYIAKNDKFIIDKESLEQAKELQGKHIDKILNDAIGVKTKNREEEDKEQRKIRDLLCRNRDLKVQNEQYRKVIKAIESHWSYVFLRDTLRKIDFKR